MKNILNFYKEDEFSSKWWHRFAKVFIYGSTVVIFIFSTFWFFTSFSDWNNPDPKYIYSFEPKYKEIFGFTQPCTFLPANDESFTSIKCGNVGEKWKGGNYGYLPDFLDRYSKSIEYKEEFLTREIVKNNSFFNPLNSEGFAYGKLNIDYIKLNKKIEQKQFNNISAKKIVLLGPLMRNVGIMFLVPILWFIFMKSVIYRSIIYIIFGNKK